VTTMPTGNINASHFDASAALDLYEQMWTIRLFENMALDLFKKGLVRGTVHPSLGQEAIAVGVCSLLRPSDYVLSTYRGHGHCIAKGADLVRMAAELLGRIDGYCKGKGGSMHICDPAIGFLGANGIVGAGLPIAGGAALSQQLQGSDGVSVCFFGDGASNQGVFHETANMAAIWKLPLIFVCENNGYGLSASTETACSVKDIASRAAGYGFPGESVDGNDLPAVIDATARAVKRARSGHGPTLLEFKTYRWERHSVLSRMCHANSSDATAWIDHDPIPLFLDWLKQNHQITTADDDRVRERASQRIEDAAALALRSAITPLEEATTDVYE
jgi:TPP-dependent pyruvate/acetoin dehydrogenase alpha subunit